MRISFSGFSFRRPPYTPCYLDCPSDAFLFTNASAGSYQCLCNDGYYLLNETCTPLFCQFIYEQHTTFEGVLSSANGTVSVGTCDYGYYSTGPILYCTQDGPLASWAVNITNPCLRKDSSVPFLCNRDPATHLLFFFLFAAVYCPVSNASNATWPQTIAGTQLQVSCQPGYYSSNPTTGCVQNITVGYWVPLAVPCTPVYCPPDNSNPTVVTWPSILSDTWAPGTCATGYYSANPERYCQQNQNQTFWSTITNPCLAVYCPAESFDNVNWPQTQAPATALGVCVGGRYSVGALMSCSQIAGGVGNWSDVVTNPCTREFLSRELSPFSCFVR